VAKQAAAPRGFYTAADAIKRLGMARSSFYDLVDKEVVKKVIQPGRSEGYYLKVAIDELAKARELFTIQYATDSATFSKATEKDIRGIYEVALSLWGTQGTYPYEQRLARYKKNPDIYYVLKYTDIVVGFSTLMPITPRSVDEIEETGKPGYEVISLDDILPFTTEEPIEYLFLEIAVRDDVPKPKQYAMHLISGTLNEIEDFARKGVTFKKLWATSRTTNGIDISRKLGFTEKPLPPNGETLVFELDTETSTNPHLAGYQTLIKERERNTKSKV